MQIEIFMVVGYVLMSSAIGLFSAGALVQLRQGADGGADAFARNSFSISSVLMVAGAACTLLHLGNAGYFYGILSNFESWLTRESWLVGAFALTCIAASVLVVRNKTGAKTPLNVICVMGMVFGCLLLFCMSMAYMTASAIPSWNDMGVLVTNVTEMLALGSALALLLAFLERDGEHAGALRRVTAHAAVVSSILALLAFVCYFVTLTLLPATSVVMSGFNNGLVAAKVVLLAVAAAAAVALVKRLGAARMPSGLVFTFVIAVAASDVLSRMLHFSLATHIPLVF